MFVINSTVRIMRKLIDKEKTLIASRIGIINDIFGQGKVDEIMECDYKDTLPNHGLVLLTNETFDRFQKSIITILSFGDGKYKLKLKKKLLGAHEWDSFLALLGELWVVAYYFNKYNDKSVCFGMRK